MEAQGLVMSLLRGTLEAVLKHSTQKSTSDADKWTQLVESNFQTGEEAETMGRLGPPVY
jgi:hypothetical protein